MGWGLCEFGFGSWMLDADAGLGGWVDEEGEGESRIGDGGWLLGAREYFCLHCN